MQSNGDDRELGGKRSDRNPSKGFRIHTCWGARLGIGEHGSPAVQSQDSFPIGYRGHLTVMLRDGGHLFGHVTVNIL